MRLVLRVRLVLRLCYLFVDCFARVLIACTGDCFALPGVIAGFGFGGFGWFACVGWVFRVFAHLRDIAWCLLLGCVVIYCLRFAWFAYVG